MLKTKKKIVTVVQPRYMNVIQGDDPEDWHAQASIVRGGNTANVFGHDRSREPVEDKPGLSGIRMPAAQVKR